VGCYQEARRKPFVAALAVVAFLTVPAVRAAPLVSQFRPDNEPTGCLARAARAGGVDLVPARLPVGFGPYADLGALDAAEPEARAGTAGPRPLGLLGRLRLSAFLLFLFPQHTLAIPSKSPPPPPPSLIAPASFFTGGQGLVPPNHTQTLSLPPFGLPPILPPSVPPVAEAPEPATLLSGALGAVLAGAFACWRRRRS
jgi:hypothetical protein